MTVPPWPRPSAPPPPAPGAPDAPPHRPESVTAVLQLGALAVLCQLVVLFASYPMMRAEARTVSEELGRDSGRSTADLDRYTVITAVATLVVLAVLMVALAVVAAVLLVKGYGWVRYLIAWLAGVLALSLVFDALGISFGTADGDLTGQLPAWTAIPRIVGGVAAIGVFLAALHHDTRRYGEQGAARRAARSHSQRPGPQEGFRR